jgi:hypothetical protein
MSLITSSPIDIETTFNMDDMLKERKYTQWAIDSIVQHFNDILTTIEFIEDMNAKHGLTEVYTISKLVLATDATDHNRVLAKYHNNIVKKFNSLRSNVLKKELIKKYIQHIKDTINEGRGEGIQKKNKTKNAKKLRKRTKKRV